MKRTILLAPVTAVLVAAGISAAGAADRQPSETDLAQARLEQAYDEFARPQQDADKLPLGAIDEIEAGPAARFGLTRADARLVRHSGGVKWFVIANAESVCTAKTADDSSSRQVACGDADQLTTAPIVGVAPTADGYDVSGVVPDGVRDVTVVYADGTTAAASPEGNVLSVVSSKAPLALEYAAADGSDASLPLVAPPAQG